MKVKSTLALLSIAFSSIGIAQTNTFPSTGNAGIGTTSPNGKLEIVGDLIVNRMDSIQNANLWIGPTGYQALINYNSSSGHLEVAPRSGYSTVFTSGNVGIGTAAPTHKLAVNGTVRAKEVLVDTDWSDFVFEDGYQLRSLDEVEAHIAEHGHLPDVPSASTVEAEGLSVGEAQKIMMQKIEELTLYMIELKKENETLKTRVADLESN